MIKVFKRTFLLLPYFIKSYILKIFTIFKFSKNKIRLGNNNYITPDCSFGKYASLKDDNILFNTSIGDLSYISSNCILSNTQIGKFCSIGDNLKTGLGKHPTRNFISTHPIFYSNRKQSIISFVNKNHFKEFENIKIGNDVWIGIDVVILDGITIGNGAIIGAKSLVTKDVEPYSIVGGVPARLIRMRFDNKFIVKLQKFKWWDKSIYWIEKNHKKFLNEKLFKTLIS